MGWYSNQNTFILNQIGSFTLFAIHLTMYYNLFFNVFEFKVNFYILLTVVEVQLFKLVYINLIEMKFWGENLLLLRFIPQLLNIT